MRTVLIWITGILASAQLGFMLGMALPHALYDDHGLTGMSAGVLLFCCLRLWLAAPRPNSEFSEQ